MRSLTALEELDLHRNQFTDIPRVITELPNLSWLDLEDNPWLGANAKIWKDQELVELKRRLKSEQHFKEE